MSYGGGGGYPPARYSPTAPSYGDAPYRNNAPPGGLPPFPPPSFGRGGPPMPPTQFRSPYDEYSPSSSSFPPQNRYDEPRRSYEQDVYDPYQPAAYDPVTPQMRSYASSMPTSSAPPATSAPPRARSPPPRPVQRSMHELPLLTPPTTTTIGTYTATVYALPPSQLPIVKYVTVSPGDAVDLHRAICQTGTAESLWYAESNVRGGEGWGAAVEWVLESGMSGAKLRTCLGETDALGAEMGAMLKAVEGFRDKLQEALRQHKNISHEFVLFCSSAAAIVSIDTSSRPESREFCHMWREICTEFLKANLTIVHLPKGSDVEGYVLAEKIANVASSNSFQKRKKERQLDEIYNRPGGGEAAPGGSTVGGSWQRGDADPSHRKSPFERPKPLPPLPPIMPTPPPAVAAAPPSLHPSLPPRPEPLQPALSPPPRHSPRPSPRPESRPSSVVDPDEEGIQPRADALCVTNFPDDASAKDIGILFAQFGEIVSVDIFSIPPVKPRFAFVAYADMFCRAQAIKELHQQPIQLDTPFARENAEDLAIWKGWNGVLTVVESDPDRLVPLSISKDLPDLPDYAVDSRSAAGHKRERPEENQVPDSPSGSRSPKKRRLPSDQPEVTAAQSSDSSSHARPVSLPAGPPPQAIPDAPESQSPVRNGPHNSHTTLPPAPLTVPASASAEETPAQPAAAKPSINPPTPVTIGAKTLQAQIDLVKKVFVKHDVNNWIAHTCLIATDLDQIRRLLQDDLYATDEAYITGRDLEATLSERGFTVARMDAFVSKVLKVLDGIAAEDEPGAAAASGPEAVDIAPLQAELEELLQKYPEQTREAMASAATVLEYLNRGREAQDAKRLEVERRVGVLQGMVKIGEQVSSVVRFLLSES